MEEKKVPALRFRGFDNAWEQRCLGECFEERNENMPKGELISVTINDGVKRFSELGRHDNSNENKSKYKKVCVGDIPYNSMRMWQGASGYSMYEGIVSPAYTVLKPKEGVNSRCVSYLFKREDMIHTFQLNSQGITSDNWNLKYPKLSQIGIFLPLNLREQEKIVECFVKLDHLISLHQRKLEMLKKVKKSMLEKMFPKNDAKVPEVRFSDFTDAWEQHKVREVADRYDNLRIPVAANLRISGSTPYYGANGIQDYVDGYTHEGEFVLVAEDGANDLKNYPVKCVKGRIWVNNHAHVLQSKNEIADNKFLAFAISQADIEALLVGGGRAKLNAETLMEINMLLPKKQEQVSIGNYFTNLDHLISFHQRKLEKLKNIKKSMLEKIFII